MPENREADYKVLIVTDEDEADQKVLVVAGGAAVDLDLTGASPGDTIVVGEDGGLEATSAIPRGELAYAERTVTSFDTDQTTAQDVTGLVIAPVVASRPIMVRAWAYTLSADTAGSYAVMQIMEGADVLSQGFRVTASGADLSVPVLLEARLTPSPGEHTYRVTLHRAAGANSVHLYAGVDQPAFIQAVEV